MDPNDQTSKSYNIKDIKQYYLTFIIIINIYLYRSHRNRVIFIGISNIKNVELLLIFRTEIAATSQYCQKMFPRNDWTYGRIPLKEIQMIVDYILKELKIKN